MSTRLGIFLLICLLVSGCSDDKTGHEATKQEVVTEAERVPVNGKEIYDANCLPCHAAGPGHAGTMRLAIRLGEDKAVLTERNDLHPDYIKSIVRQGIMLMPPFRPSEITDDELEALALYLAKQET